FFRRQVTVGGFIAAVALGHTVSFFDTGNTALHANGAITFFFGFTHCLKRGIQILTVGVGVGHDVVAAAATEQLIERHIGRLGLDVPERCIDSSQSGHAHRAATPVGAAVNKLPDIFNLVGVPANKYRNQIVFKVGDHGFFATI